MTNTELNKKACELLNIHWHETQRQYVASDIKSVCKKCGAYGIINIRNPDFTSPAGRVELMEIMEGK